MAWTATDLFNMERKDQNLAHQFIDGFFPLGGGTPVALMLNVFTSALLFFATIWLIWQLIMTVVRSASHGKTFSDDVSWIHGPLRSVFGVGSLAPLPGIGYSAIHYALFCMIMMGSNLADAMLVPLYETVIGESQPLRTSTLNGKQFVWKIVESEVCVAVHNNYNTHVGGPARRISLPDPDGMTLPSRNESPGWWSGFWSGAVLETNPHPLNTAKPTSQHWRWGASGECGVMTFDNTYTDTDFASARNKLIADLIKDVREEVATYFDLAGPRRDAAYAFFRSEGYLHGEKQDSAREKEFIELAIELRDADKMPNMGEYLDRKGREWNEKISQAASNAARLVADESRHRVLEFLETSGWMSFGTPVRMMTQSSAASIEMATEAPEGQGPTITEAYQKHYNAAMALLRGVAQLHAPNISAQDFAGPGDASGNKLFSLLAPFSKTMTEGVIQYLGSDVAGQGSVDPIGGMVSLGHITLDAIWAVVALEAASKMFDWLPIVGTATSVLSSLFVWSKVILVPMVVAGISYAYILPALPLVFSLIGIFAWVVAFMEAMLALPLMMLMAVRIESKGDFFDEFLKPGLNMMIGLVLRPPLMVAIGAMNLLTIPLCLTLLNKLWAVGFVGQQGGNVVVLMGILIGVLGHCWLCWQIFLRLSSLTQTGPDRILMIMGVHSPNMGEDNDAATVAAGLVALSRKIPIEKEKKSGGGSDKDKDAASIGKGKSRAAKALGAATRAGSGRLKK